MLLENLKSPVWFHWQLMLYFYWVLLLHPPLHVPEKGQRQSGLPAVTNPLRAGLDLRQRLYSLPLPQSQAALHWVRHHWESFRRKLSLEPETVIFLAGPPQPPAGSKQSTDIGKLILHAECLWMLGPRPPKPLQCCPLLAGYCKCSVRSLRKQPRCVNARVY